jgi:hypothetical protein
MPPEEVFTAAPPGASYPALPPACAHTKTYSKEHRRRQMEADEVSSSMVVER